MGGGPFKNSQLHPASSSSPRASIDGSSKSLRSRPHTHAVSLHIAPIFFSQHNLRSPLPSIRSYHSNHFMITILCTSPQPWSRAFKKKKKAYLDMNFLPTYLLILWITWSPNFWNLLVLGNLTVVLKKKKVIESVMDLKHLSFKNPELLKSFISMQLR